MAPDGYQSAPMLAGFPVAPAASALTLWFATAARKLPWRAGASEGTELREPAGYFPSVIRGQESMARAESPAVRRRDPYRTWISEIMLQQTQVATVLEYYARWMERFPTVHALSESAEEDVLGLWAGLGYYSRARNLLATAKEVVGKHGGSFPSKRSELLLLKGIGEYTAGAIASLAYNLPEPILDGNLIRVFSRVYGLDFLPDTAPGKKAYWEIASAWVRAGEPGVVNEALMELGALVCAPRSPACAACPLSPSCRARASGKQESYPPPKKRKETRTLAGYALVIRRQGKVLLYRPGPGELLSGLLTFPFFPLAGSPNLRNLSLEWATRFPGIPAPSFRPISGLITHGITHHSFKVRLAEAELGETPLDPWPQGHFWVEEARIASQLVSSLPKKVWELWLQGQSGRPRIP